MCWIRTYRTGLFGPELPGRSATERKGVRREIPERLVRADLLVDVVPRGKRLLELADRRRQVLDLVKLEIVGEERTLDPAWPLGSWASSRTA